MFDLSNGCSPNISIIVVIAYIVAFGGGGKYKPPPPSQICTAVCFTGTF